jgi:hypothetical protein
MRHIPGDVLNYHQARLLSKEGPVLDAARKLFSSVGVHPEFVVTDQTGAPAGGVETHQYRNGGVAIVGLLTNPQLRVDELGPPEFKSNQRFEKTRQLRLTLPREEFVFDIRRAKDFGRTKSVELSLDPYEPVLLAISASAPSALHVAAPKRLARGATGHVGFSIDSPAAIHVLHIDVTDASGKALTYYSGNLLAPNGRTSKSLPLAYNDPVGPWRLIVRDLLTGQSVTTEIEVY